MAHTGSAVAALYIPLVLTSTLTPMAGSAPCRVQPLTPHLSGTSYFFLEIQPFAEHY